MVTEEGDSKKPDWIEAVENSVCFDAEPLLAYYWDAEGSDRVEDYFAEILQGERHGYVSHITYCEIRYHILRENTGGFFHFREFLQDTTLKVNGEQKLNVSVSPPDRTSESGVATIDLECLTSTL